MKRTYWSGLVVGLVMATTIGCAGTANKPSERPSPSEEGEDYLIGASDGEAPASEIDADEAAKQAAAQKVLATVKDRDPEEERRKLENSRKISRNAAGKLASNKLGDAIKTAREALKVHEQNVDAMLVIAEAYYKEGKYELVRAVTSSALQVDAKIRTPAETSRAYNLQGFAMVAMGEDSQATQLFKKAAEADEKNAAAWNNLGTRYLDAGDVATSISCFQYAIELEPRFFKAHLNYGAALRANRQWEEAEAAILKSLELRPGYAEAYFNLGVLYLDADPFPGLDTTQRLNKAIQHLGKYQQLAVGDGVTGPKRRKGTGAAGTGQNPPARVSKARADDYIRVANKGLEKEARAKDRAKEREAKAAQEANEPPPSEEGAVQGVAADDPAPTDGPTPEQPGDAGADPPAPQGPATETPGGEAPAPSQPSPQGPSKPAPQGPAQPAPEQPAPSKPAPSKPAPQGPAQPAPEKPAPSKPAPSKPAPQGPAQPAPEQPAPSKPAPSKPAPQGPSSPAPSKPAPSKPTPVQPQKPAPQKPQSASNDLGIPAGTSGHDGKKNPLNPRSRGTRLARATLNPMGADASALRVDLRPRPYSSGAALSVASSWRVATAKPAAPSTPWSSRT